ncbi:hypothetical protein [Pseudomonas sp. IT-P74]|uniref:hypothetical protein n=1 Tax=Pseudomonas sp. IT-P74 TaxID=3026445 RepID=UPI0039E074D3
MLAMVVNDNAYLLAKRGVLESIASKLAPTTSLTEQHYGFSPGPLFAGFSGICFRLMKSLCVANSMARMMSKEFQQAREARHHWFKPATDST